MGGLIVSTFDGHRLNERNRCFCPSSRNVLWCFQTLSLQYFRVFCHCLFGCKHSWEGGKLVDGQGRHSTLISQCISHRKDRLDRRMMPHSQRLIFPYVLKQRVLWKSDLPCI